MKPTFEHPLQRADRVIINELFQPLHDWQARLRQASDHLISKLFLLAAWVSEIGVDLYNRRPPVLVGVDFVFGGLIVLVLYVLLVLTERRASRNGIKMGALYRWGGYRFWLLLCLAVWFGMLTWTAHGRNPHYETLLDDTFFLLAAYFAGVELRDPPPPLRSIVPAMAGAG